MPAGGPMSVVYMLGQFRTWGLSYATAAFAVVASGLLSTITFAGLAAGCGLATGRADVAIAVAGVATVAIAATYVARRSFGLAPATVIATLVCRTGKVLTRISSAAGEALQTASVELASIRPRQRDWAGAGGFAALNWIADFASLIAAAHAVPGVSGISVVVLLAAYLAGMSASSVAVLPGGFGVVEIAMIATLHAGGLATAAATATVLLYRLASCVLVVAIGWLTMAASAAA
jgi:putative heme transporter